MDPKSKILLVEDDTPSAMRFTAILTAAGYELQVERTGTRGLEKACVRKFDLIMLDVDSPEVDGLAINTELKQRHISYRTPLVFLSDHLSIEDQQRALASGINDVFHKNLSRDELIFRIASLLEATTAV